MIPSTLLAAAALLAAATEPTVARVDAVSITRAMVEKRGAEFRAQGANLPATQVAQTLVDEALLAAEGERLGVRGTPAAAERLAQARRELAASALLDADLAAITPPEATLRAIYHSSNDFARMHTLTFETRAAAQAARDRIAKGAQFAAEAKGATVSQLHASPDAAPFLLRAQLAPELADLVFAAKPGAVVGPVASGPGFALAQVIDVRIGDEAGFAAKRDPIAVRARQQIAGQARGHLLKQLRAKAAVHLDEAFLKNVNAFSPTPAEQAHVIASVNGRPVRYADVLPSLLAIAQGGIGGHLGGPTVRVQLAWQVIDARLLQDLAMERGFDRRPEVLAQLPAAERNVLALLTAEKIRSSGPGPDDREIHAWYDRNAASIRKPLSAVLGQVAAAAAAEKAESRLIARVAELRKKAAIHLDTAALATLDHR